MGRRIQNRTYGGRFTQNTVENTFGLHLQVCPWSDCGQFNPRDIGEPAKISCKRCTRPLVKDPQATLMSCGHYANTITHDTLTPLCDICMNVETWVD